MAGSSRAGLAGQSTPGQESRTGPCCVGGEGNITTITSTSDSHSHNSLLPWSTWRLAYLYIAVRQSWRFYLISDLVTDIPTSDDGDQDDDVKLPQAMAASVFVSRALPA